MEIAKGQDDGTVIVPAQGVAANQFLGTASGAVPGGEQSLLSAGAVLYLDEQIQTRALYRFDISQWSEGNITFRTQCMMRFGTPGDLEVYVTVDFGELDPELSDPEDEYEDVEAYWTGESELLGSLNPSDNDWIEVVVPEDTVAEYKSEEGYIAFRIKATGETIEATALLTPNAYMLTCYERVQYNSAADPPNVTWTI